MCRLYGMRANEPTKVECSLVHAQNALMVQSRQDRAGYSHAHGWGVATYEDHMPHIERQAWAAYHGEHFRRTAARIYATTVLAHVRRATVGPPGLENTHPFSHGPWTMIHNGTIPHFGQLRDRMLAMMNWQHRAEIHGVTDSEHFFHFVMSRHRPGEPIFATLRAAAETVIGWCREIDPEARIGLNVILTDGIELVGIRLGRGLHYIERDGIYDCEICGVPHIHHEPRQHYREVVLASEPITHEVWQEMPEASIYEVTPEIALRIESL